MFLCVSGPRLSLLLFCFTNLSVGLWPCSCKMAFETLDIIFVPKARRKRKEQSVVFSSFRKTIAYSEADFLGSLARTG